ncbi:hypothetical protein BGX33_000348 [Mortierella sp. NVP41]|nr:hypothetical protein BGX33_000348 [Mortierella sp. NVP41]
MTDTTRPNIASVPELVETIGFHLTVPELARCAQTCGLWNQALTPLLWETFDDRSYGWPRILSMLDSDEIKGQQDKTWLDSLFAKYGHHIRTLRFEWHSTVAAAFDYGACTRLLFLQSFNFGNSLTVREKEMASKYVIRSGRSSSITDREGLYPETRTYILPMFKDVIEPCHSMSWIPWADQERNWMTTQRFLVLVHQNSSTLCSLRLDPSLERLCRIDSFERLDRILFGLQNLVELSNTMYLCDLDQLLHQYPASRFAGLLRPQLQQTSAGIVTYPLKEVRFTNPDKVTSGLLSGFILPALPHLKHLRLDQLLKGTAVALVTHCKDLETFCQNRDRDATGPVYNPWAVTNTVLKLLKEYPNLKILDAMQHRIQAHSLMIGASWVCHRLETFRCQIIGVSRLSKSEMRTLHNLFRSGSVKDKDAILTDEEKLALKGAQETAQQQQ